MTEDINMTAIIYGFMAELQVDSSRMYQRVQNDKRIKNYGRTLVEISIFFLAELQEGLQPLTRPRGNGALV